LKQADNNSLEEILKKIKDLIYPDPELEVILNKIKDNVELYNIKLVLVVHPLKEFNFLENSILNYRENTLLVDNSKVFKKKIKSFGYQAQFSESIDYFSPHAANLLAENILYYLLKHIFR
ncbi:MAG: hypothetical protein NC900_05045, partial [Candidatus Omnitrophica bacterium]|nr:hypothetical protein [Candidatus Omnitrophota bacterium]